MVKRVLQKLWNDRCTIIIRTKAQNPTSKRTEFVETVLYSNQPCKLSFETLTSTSEASNVPYITQGAKVFLDNELSVPDGSKIVVVREGKTFTFKASGEPGWFSNHQEIYLKLFEDWA